MHTAQTISHATSPKLPLLQGLILSALIAAAATAAANISWLSENGFSALTIAILLGMLVGNTLYPRIAPACGAGVNFSKQNLLRLGIVLYGFRLTFQDIGHVGLSGVVIDALVLSSTFFFALIIGTRVFKLDRNTALLIGAGSAICGAAAVMATEPVVKAHPAQVTVAVATVVVFGSLAIFIYPLLYQLLTQLNSAWHMFPDSALAFGIYTGSTVHEVAQVIAATHAISPEIESTAVIAKMVRVMMLAPFLILLAMYMSKIANRTANHQVSKKNTSSASTALPYAKKARLTIPWFAFGFIAVVALNSLAWLPTFLISAINQIDAILLAMAMAALGLSTHFSAIRTAGIKPLLFAAMLFAWLIIGGALINVVVLHILG